MLEKEGEGWGGASMRNTRQALVLLLAGGVGSRLNILVEQRAKPAVPFGGIYRIIDFSLSNVTNSRLQKVGVLTQYKPLSLMNHLGAGEAWDLTGRTRGVKILPPRTGAKDSDWYKGTADAVRRNIDFIEANPSEEVLILSGDHIYHMDFEVMLEYHRSKKADVTVSMMVVPKSQIRHYGAGIIDDKNRIIDWEEKPEKPRSNLASMGIYVFDRNYLLEALARNKDELDFGMHLLPWAIENDNVFAYPFYGYWRDVGTIQAYWQANMDILNPDSGLLPEQWGIITNVESSHRIYDWPPARYGYKAELHNSMIAAGCRIEGTVVNSILAPGVTVEKGAMVQDSILFEGCTVRKDGVVDLAIVDKYVEVSERAVVGYGDGHDVVNCASPDHLYTGITVIGKRVTIPSGITIGRNCAVHGFTTGDKFPASGLNDGETLLQDGTVK
ncbi:glucose-1-phosphate adenylyltransferase family protein [Desulfosediminicola ganghwensis]|uniref:glucose-1-phosphate adenylyltransferase family protein n=1 Tax=Desulfosediminicola ganghwensis TaxID=2569540 RepID=UPI001E31ADB5|nr:sugar phosphate nucleotidyltransferase [Desulfosediminicola ganghwensis]